eukprot:14673704-Alexandrium_andersonii.AAC.1
MVVRGYTEPDMLSLRTEPPTVGKLSRNMCVQVAASYRWLLRKGDVSTAFLQGLREESEREVFAEPPDELRKALGIARERVVRLEGS